MNLITLESVGKQFSDRVLLEDASLLINSGDRIGLIGPNGSGKTTLLRIIAGSESADNGQVTVWGNVAVEMLWQEPELDDELTVLETILQSAAPQIQMVRDYEATSRQLGKEPGNLKLQRHLTHLTTELDRTGGWSAMSQAKSVLTRLGIAEFDDRIGTLSGGQRKRVALARALIAPADLLILDEPTNHIDANTVAWMELYLLKRAGALLMVTHDRYFLERVANRIVQLENRSLVNYPGNYARYLEQSSKRQQQLTASARKRQNLLRQELAWLRRGAMARGTKQKARKQRINELQQLGHDQGNRRIAIALASRRLGKKVLAADGLSKSYGPNTLFENLSFELEPGDRIGIVGPNGAGKSTFLNLLAGKETAELGTVSWGPTVALAYYDQQSAELLDQVRVIDFVEEKASVIRTDDGRRIEAAQMLDWFLFPRPEQRAWISSLSGGERRRLYLLYCLMQQPNVLFLDEPTNDLDIQTLTVLEQFLDHFEGSLIVVSHDRYFLDRNVDYLVSFEKGSFGKRFPTPYETFQEMRDAVKEREPESIAPPAKRDPVPRARSLTWKERRELESLEGGMAELEERVGALESEINASGDAYERLRKLAVDLERLREQLALAEERWLELSEIQESDA